MLAQKRLWVYFILLWGTDKLLHSQSFIDNNRAIYASHYVGCAPLTTQFFMSIVDVDSCKWFFGDGKQSKELNPLHTYTKPGKYTVEVIAYKGRQSYNFVKTDWIEVARLPKAEFKVDTLYRKIPYSKIRFRAKDSSAKEYIWDFGDGNKGYGRRVTHFYRTEGTFLVKLTVKNHLDCEVVSSQETYITIENSYEPYADFAANSTLGCDTLNVTFKNLSLNTFAYEWDFGDGSPVSKLPEPSHTYTKPGKYTVSLKAIGAKGEHFTFKSDYIVVGNTPEIDFVADYPRSAIDEEISFKPIDNEQFVSYEWNFGDYTVSKEKYPKHTYKKAGYYTVTLTGITSEGCIVTEIKKDYIHITSDTRLENLRLGNKIVFGKIYPNPCGPTAIYSFYIPEPALVSTVLYNAQGQKIATLLQEERMSGIHKFELQELLDVQMLSSGVYFIKTNINGIENVQKIIWIK
ncbi:MAG: PKD domain-containing protein [Bacteroidia bacterium]|nr:PKD domain-containing protein [Bacteroidia bacterium]MDW8302705.1 PKD domain-containing protein [Bacteroidia bacterium]